MAIDEHIQAGQTALQKGRWKEAVSAFEASLAEQETPEALEGLGEALWWLCDARASVRYRERAYVTLRRAGDDSRACMTAINLSISYLLNLGNEAASRGWLARAERLMPKRDPVQGWVWLMQGFLSEDPDRSQELLARALDSARGSGDSDLELVALADLGLALVAGGKAEEGMAMLDEAMAGTLGGEYTRLETVVYTSCNMLAGCNLLGDLERASQWCRVADDFMRDYSSPFLFARCRAYYGSVLLAKGRWTRAEEELQAAVSMSEDAGPGPREEALARLADLRFRQGRLEEAQALLDTLDDPSTATLPASAVHLARGESSVAVTFLERRLEHMGEREIEMAPTLAMLVDAHIASADPDAAKEVAARLSTVAEAQGGAHASALALLASARVSSAEGRSEDAIDQLEKALEGFSHLALPLEAARVRLELARALADSRTELAIAQARSALTAFEDLGAAADADAASSLLRSLGASGRMGPKRVGILTKREQEVLGLVALGLSNPEIAKRLFISRKTAAHHVSNVLAKLGLRNRAEAVAYAARTSNQPARK